MSYKVMFVLNVLVALVLGLACLFVPARVLQLFGSEARVPELLLARFFGVALVTVGLLLWFAKDADARVQKGLGWALLLGLVFGLIVTVIGMSPASGVIRSNGWIAILVSVLFALGYGFLLFLKPKMKE